MFSKARVNEGRFSSPVQCRCRDATSGLGPSNPRPTALGVSRAQEQPTLSQVCGLALGLIDAFITLSAQICLVSSRFSLGPAISELLCYHACLLVFAEVSNIIRCAQSRFFLLIPSSSAVNSLKSFGFTLSFLFLKIAFSLSKTSRREV